MAYAIRTLTGDVVVWGHWLGDAERRLLDGEQDTVGGRFEGTDRDLVTHVVQVHVIHLRGHRGVTRHYMGS